MFVADERRQPTVTFTPSPPTPKNCRPFFFSVHEKQASNLQKLFGVTTLCVCFLSDCVMMGSSTF